MKSLIPFLVLASALFSTAALAEVLNTIKANKTIRLGVRSDNGGLSYAIGKDEYGGFHVDLCRRAVKDMEAQFNQTIQVVYVPVTAQSRIPSILNGSIDMECGATTNNLARQKYVAFAVTTYVEEVRVVTRAQAGINSVNQLAGKLLATTAGTTSLPLIRKHQRSKQAEMMEVTAKTDIESFELMASGKADAYVMDAQILAAFISGSKKPEDFKVLDEVLSVEPIAIMLPQNSPALKKLVDDSFKAMMRSGEIETLYKKWFLEPIPPNQTRINLPVSEATRKAWADPNDKPADSY
jgi:glutamate/aspartate transport system substrate-binding protein